MRIGVPGLALPMVTAVTRLDYLSRRDNATANPRRRAAAPTRSRTARLRGEVEPLDLEESLELLDLGVVVAGRADDAQHLGIRAALRCGASWARIGDSLGTTPLTAWNRHQRWIEEQVERFEVSGGRDGLDDAGAMEALHLAGQRPAGLGYVRRGGAVDPG